MDYTIFSKFSELDYTNLFFLSSIFLEYFTKCYVKIICAHVGNDLWTCLPAVGRVKSFRDEPPIMFCPPCRP